jgi:cell wall-associated NlpC family hydrolase
MVRTPIQALLLVMLALVALVLPASAAAEAGVVSTTAEQRTAAADHAATRAGSPYARGAAGPRRFDCSGLVTWAYTKAGAPLTGRSSFEMWEHGVRIKRSALRRGDLVWTWDRSFGHVGIYLGEGRYVHAPGAGRRVEIAPLPSGRSFIGAVRP